MSKSCALFKESVLALFSIANMEIKFEFAKEILILSGFTNFFYSFVR